MVRELSIFSIRIWLQPGGKPRVWAPHHSALYAPLKPFICTFKATRSDCSPASPVASSPFPRASALWTCHTTAVPAPNGKIDPVDNCCLENTTLTTRKLQRTQKGFLVNLWVGNTLYFFGDHTLLFHQRKRSYTKGLSAWRTRRQANSNMLHCSEKLLRLKLPPTCAHFLEVNIHQGQRSGNHVTCR